MAKPKTGGRQKGTPNKVTLDLKGYALGFTQEAIDGLVEIARDKQSPCAARVAAWDKVLDRAVGKAPQAITGADGGDIGLVIRKIERVIVDSPANPNPAGLRSASEAG